MNRFKNLGALAAVSIAISISSFALAENLASRDPASKPVTRELSWDGSNTLIVDVPATVRFVQSTGPGKVVVTGAPRSVDNFTVSGGVLRDDRWRTGKPLSVVVHAPAVTRFVLKGGDTLQLEGFNQPELHIETTGRAEVKGTGQTGRLTLQLQGFGWVDLSGLQAKEADVNLTGARHALIAATERARVVGNGSVVLVTSPKTLDVALGESGRVFDVGTAVAK
jgi:hypothetical protein